MTGKPISPLAHGVLDYTVGASLVALPHVLGWTGKPKTILQVAGLTHMAYSLFTKYKMGVKPVIPFETHLAADAAGAAAIGAAAGMMTDQPKNVRAVFGGLALMETLVLLMTSRTGRGRVPENPLKEALSGRL